MIVTHLMLVRENEQFALQSVKFQSVSFHPCDLVRQIPVLQIQLSQNALYQRAGSQHWLVSFACRKEKQNLNVLI